jgi:predicted RNase H-like HicB family nuclease
MVKNVIFRVEIFKENDQFIALCPELNVSSFDDTVEGAKRSIHEAVELFLEECEEEKYLFFLSGMSKEKYYISFMQWSV